MSQVFKRPRARADLIEIWNYIAEDSEARADAFVEIIDQKLQILAERPNIGRERKGLVGGLRSFPVGRYVIFYMPHHEGIDVIRVLHGARDLDTALGAEDELF